jgi:outer membrane protein assembly factor BamA
MKHSYYLYRILLFAFFSLHGLNCLLAQQIGKNEDLDNDSTEVQFIIGKIIITGNQKTRESIILRELTFREGDCVTETLLKIGINQSRINLLKLPLFNYVNIDIIPVSPSSKDIYIIVEERWFLWPQLAIINNERNFNAWLQKHDFSNLDYQLSIKKYNSLGLNQIASGGISYGYTRELSLGYQNIAIGQKKKHYIGVIAKYSQFQSFFYRIYQNKQESFSSSYGDVLTNKYFRIEYSFRPAINIQHKLNLTFRQVDISDSLLMANPIFLAGSKKQNSFIEAQYYFTFDKRNSRSYPLLGTLLHFSMAKTGFEFRKASSVNILNLSLTAKQYYPIKGRLYAAHSFTLRKSLNNFQPYYYKVNLGYNDYIRGFEYYLIESDDYYLSKNDLKFELVPQTIKYLNFIPLKKFKKIHYAMYLNTFFDIGYSHNRNSEETMQNNLSNKVLYSFGLGFDLVTYYDKVISLEYSINSLFQKGFFLHFIAPI